MQTITLLYPSLLVACDCLWQLTAGHLGRQRWIQFPIHPLLLYDLLALSNLSLSPFTRQQSEIIIVHDPQGCFEN